jgi:hypothetical protein
VPAESAQPQVEAGLPAQPAHPGVTNNATQTPSRIGETPSRELEERQEIQTQDRDRARRTDADDQRRDKDDQRRRDTEDQRRRDTDDQQRQGPAPNFGSLQGQSWSMMSGLFNLNMATFRVQTVKDADLAQI